MRKLLKLVFVRIPLWSAILSVTLVLLLKWGDPAYTPLMLRRAIEFRADDDYARHQEWKPMEDVSEAFLKAVIAAEDSRFFTHHGFEPGEMCGELIRFGKGEREIRGCSTISQQTAKNVFTLGSRTWFRKGVEAWFTFLIERIWGKERILEVYLNVAEFGKGIYGVEAASRHYFHTAASRLTLAEASSLVLCLPCPLDRTPNGVNNKMAGRRNKVAREAKRVDLPFDCSARIGRLKRKRQ